MSQRKEYRRAWMAQKRRVMRDKKAASKIITLHSDSDSDTQTSTVLSDPPVPNLPTGAEYSTNPSTNNCIVETCDRETVQPAENAVLRDCEAQWDLIDNECFRDSQSDSESDSELNDSLLDELRTWAVDSCVTQAQLNKLLPILNKHHSELPLTAKTLLKTPAQQFVECASVSGGDYIYFGLHNSLCELFAGKEHLLSTLDEVHLAFNVDGIPLFASSSYSLWPLLCYVMNVEPHRVFTVAVYGGKSKPRDLMFLQQAVDELKQLMLDGLYINGTRLTCVPKMCVCDAVARAMVKCVKQFSGYYGCDKCSQKGKYLGRMTYPKCDAALRTDSLFRGGVNREHHLGTSPFSSLPVDMIAFFPLDYMHSVCIGVMKRLLVCWTVGGKKSKLSISQKAQVNARLAQFRLCVTKEFSRKPRTLDDLPHWKATEYRTFLLYAGYFVLRGIISDEILEHFMCLSVGIAILVSETLSVNAIYQQFAHDLLVFFVQKSVDLYGPEFVVYNVHSLTHISLEARHFGNLENSSAFIFENFMQQLKKYVRSGRNPVVQVAHRVREKNFFSKLTSPPVLLLDSLANYSGQPPNNSCILESGLCCQVIGIENENALCLVFPESFPVYSRPCDSRTIGVHQVRFSAGILKQLSLNTKAYKAIAFCDQHHADMIFLRLLHHV